MRRRAASGGRPGEIPARLYARCPHGWLSEDEFEVLSVGEKWELTGERRRGALRQYARQQRIPLAEVVEAMEPPKVRDRAQALAYVQRDQHEPCATESRERIRAHKCALVPGGAP